MKTERSTKRHMEPDCFLKDKMKMMKKPLLLIAVLLVFVSCKDSVQKPDNLIPEEKMQDILYDIALMEAIKVGDSKSLQEKGINPDTYIYQKYKIDSLQFSKSDQYYASDVKNYEKMYGKVLKRLEMKKAEIDSLVQKGVNVGETSKKKFEKKEGVQLNQVIINGAMNEHFGGSSLKKN